MGWVRRRPAAGRGAGGDAGRAVSGLVVLVASGLLLAGCGSDVTVITPPTVRSGTVDEPGATRTLTVLERALAERDRSAAAALGADSTTSSYLGDLTANAEAVDLTHVSMRYIDEQGGDAADGAWWATVETSFAYGGFDASPEHTDVSVEFRRVDSGGRDRVAIVAIGNDEGTVPIWLDGPVVVRRTPQTLVVLSGTAATPAEADTISAEARTAVRQVSSFLTWRDPRLVVELAPSLAGLARALGVDPQDEAGAAAVTSFLGQGGDGRPLHVLLDPVTFLPLPRLGAQVVLTHESTHVATRAPASTRLPEWLIEGFADYVAQRRLTLPVTRIAGRAIRLARTDGVPTHLPGTTEFHSDDGLVLEAAYEQAWLACGVVAAKAGPAGLVDLYDSVDRGESLTHALRRIAGWSPAQLLAAWQDRIRGLERSAGSADAVTRPPAR